MLADESALGAAAFFSGHTIVTSLCDGASRYASRLFNPTWLADKQLTPTATDLSFVQ